jgi:hypothetical protein
MRNPFASNQRNWPRAAAAVVLIIGAAIAVALNWPGQLSYDSVVQLHDARLGHYNPWHPPVMAWLLGIEDAVLPGTGLFILFDTLLLIASLVSLLWLAPSTSWTAVLVAAIFVGLPQFVLYQGIVWKDVLFADAAVVGLVLLAHAATGWRHPTIRWILVAASFLLLILATLVRQNGAIALVLGAVALVSIARASSVRWSRAIVYGAVAMLAAFVLVAAASLALFTRTGGVSGTAGQFRLLQLYDLIGVVKNDPAVRLGELARANPNLDRLIRSDGARLYTPARNDTLAGSTELQHAFNATDPDAIAAQWENVITTHTLAYLRVRTSVFAWTFLTPDLVQCDAWYAGTSGPPGYLRALGLVPGLRPQDRALVAYAELVPAPVYSHAAFTALAVTLLAFLLWRRRPADLAIAAMLGASLVFAASFFVISIACDYRYLLFLDLAALTAFFYSVATWRLCVSTGD